MGGVREEGLEIIDRTHAFWKKAYVKDMPSKMSSNVLTESSVIVTTVITRFINKAV